MNAHSNSVLEARSAVISEHHNDPGRGPLSFTEALGRLSEIMLSGRPLNRTLHEVADLARQAIPRVDHVSLTMMDSDRPRTVVFTGEVAQALDERQYQAGYGPCMDAALSGRTIPVSHQDPDTGYPDFSAAARSRGVTHTLSVGLPLPGRIVGGLNFYCTSQEPIDAHGVELAEVFASYAAVALLNAAAAASTADLAQDTRDAVRTRSVINMAKGILMARTYCSADTAFEILVHHAETDGRTVAEVAQSILDGAPTDPTT